MRNRLVMAFLFAAAMAFGCSETITLTGGDGGAGGCQLGGPQCNDCVDNDNDGRIDGFDPECTGAIDDDEGSFATGIPGDTGGNGVRQDCFFDGNAGSGDDGCDLHVCCSLDLGGGPCPPQHSPGSFDPMDCTPSQRCADSCEPIVPPGCDCFGCCTVCDGGLCVDIFINPQVSPGCDETNVVDDTVCMRCVKIAECNSGCDPSACVLCPGQTVDDLPPSCNGATCPGGSRPCTVDAGCETDEYCGNGCCIDIPQ